MAGSAEGSGQWWPGLCGELGEGGAYAGELRGGEQNTASAAIVGDSGSPHSQQYRRAVPPAPTTQIIQP
ncbi:hypothetical protein TUSST3_15370 [Streptomyces sp. TUS-ST3]|nr:hypothetical protein TUSST3_15370 [Streptomyces sp. TUS-ST3]